MVVDPTELLAGLNSAQRRAAEATSGPVCVLAGPGTGKTRTVTHRIAYQIATGVAEPGQVLAVTFTERAGAELRLRLDGLGIPSPVRATTFHAAAWAQLRWFWPRYRQTPTPQVLSSKVRLLADAARSARAEVRDLASEIEWAKARVLGPEDYAAGTTGRRTPVPPERMAEIYAGYEQAKRELDLIDFEDMLLLTTRLLEDEPEAAAQVRERYRFLTVDEFQDVNRAQWALLRAWLGDSNELCAVGDEGQAIYGFTGASAEYLTRFPQLFPDATVVRLVDTYRSTAQILAVADAVLAQPDLRLQPAPGAAGPTPSLRRYPDPVSEAQGVTIGVRELLDADDTPPGEIAIAYRIHSQSPPLEHALTTAEIPFTVRGEHGFFGRPVIRQALAVLTQAARGRQPRGSKAVRGVEQVLRERMSWHPRREPSGEVALERWRNLGALLEVAGGMAEPDMAFGELVEALEREAAAVTADGGRAAVTLTTLHQAKGLEFEAVFLIGVEEGLMPITHASTADDVEEERRLLYVGVTRARRHLTLSWTERRGPSRFLAPLANAPRAGRLAG